MESVLMPTSKAKLTNTEKVALMLLGGDCDNDNTGIDPNDGDWASQMEDYLDDIDWTDGLDQGEVDMINDAFDWMEQNGGFDDYLYIDENGEFHVQESTGNPYLDYLIYEGSNRTKVSGDEWDQWKEDNGY